MASLKKGKKKSEREKKEKHHRQPSRSRGGKVAGVGEGTGGCAPHVERAVPPTGFLLLTRVPSGTLAQEVGLVKVQLAHQSLFFSPLQICVTLTFYASHPPTCFADAQFWCGANAIEKMTFDFVAAGKLIHFPLVPGTSLCKEATECSLQAVF